MRAEQLLREGDWAAAYRAFAGERGPAAAEGMAAAAWWMDDDQEIFRRYEQAYRGYRETGDDAGAARAAAWLGNAALQLRGEDAVAQGWFRRAERLDPGSPLLALFLAMAALHRGDPADAARRAAEVRGSPGLSPDLEVQAMAVAGLAAVAMGRIGAGMPLLDEAVAAALAGETAEVASVWVPSCYLVQGCEHARDWERARQWSLRTMEFCRRLNLGSPYARCRTHYGTVLLWQGDWAGAETELTTAARALETRPVLAAEAWARLGELRRRQGQSAEAGELLRRGRAAPAARLGLVELHLDLGEAAEALELAERLLAGAHGLARAPVLEVLVRAGVAAGRPERVPGAARELDALAEEIGTAAVRASADWALGLLGDGARLERAVAAFTRAGDPYGAARVRLDLAARLGPGATEEARAAREEFVRLGATADAARATAFLGTLAPQELTGRQVEILRLVAAGLTNREMATRLQVSEHTVKRHVANILARLGLTSRTAAVAHALRTGLL
ncbi:LuxR C-terminal-related transcriptional regulator [Nonomuraea sediminis]|uniref:LuxR C-terminal-related transcriptional regulator n=1 Tax=Nonomuraea sediminis TaxID=2835864 RepID=UPI001BDD0F7A|nr:LuxR C-terminal-related transcriptional regulator [Nonomuraea sediminis]